MASLPTLSNAKFGFVEDAGAGVDSVARAIDHLSGKFEELCADGIPPRELMLSFVCSHGTTYTMRLTVAPGDTVGLNMGPNRMFVNLRFARYEVWWTDPSTGTVRREVGRGASEFGYRFKDYQAHRPTKADSKLRPILAASGSE